MAKLHPKQIALLKVLRRSIDNPMSVSELQEELGMSSKSVVQHHIQQLEKKGYLKRNPSNPRDYQILGDPEKPVSYLNLYGLAQCGPGGQFLDGNPLERIPLAIKLLKFPATEAFLIEAEGDSMQPNIKDGDLVIFQMKNVAENGDTIVCISGEKAFIKKYQKQGKITMLLSTNPNFNAFIPENDFCIKGIMRGVIRYQ